MRLFVCGVSGAGKTTVGSALAARLAWPFIEGDDFHPPQNLAKMRSGEPLTDADREPWLDALLAETIRHTDAIVACSALKRSYRDRIRRHLTDVRFVLLTANPAEITRRIAARHGHFAGTALIRSQFETLELLTEDEGLMLHTAGLSVPAIVERIVVEQWPGGTRGAGGN